MQFAHKPSLALALLIGAFLTAAPARAQILTLGQPGSTALSGTATLSNTGTTASGTYTYDHQNSPTYPPYQTYYNTWNVYGPSTATITGGTINDGITAYDSSTVNVSGGQVGGITLYGTSKLAVSGEGSYGISAYGSSTADLSSTGAIGVSTYDSSMADVTSGATYADTYGSSKATVSGGDVGYLYTGGTSTLDLVGRGFTETSGLSHTSPDLYLVTGTLKDGGKVDAVYDDLGGTLEFNGKAASPVPEASSLSSLGLLLGLGLGAWAVAVRCRASAAG